jgi:hypothetical protein
MPCVFGGSLSLCAVCLPHPWGSMEMAGVVTHTGANIIKVGGTAAVLHWRRCLGLSKRCSGGVCQLSIHHRAQTSLGPTSKLP